MGILSGKHFSVSPLNEIILEGKNLLLEEKILSCKSRSH